MTADEAQIWIAYGTTVTAWASTASLCFIVWQMRNSRKSTDFEILQTFLLEMQHLEQSLNAAESEEKHEQAFYTLLNAYEKYAYVSNADLIPRTSKKIVIGTLCNSLSILINDNKSRDRIEEAIIHENTFDELANFLKKHKKRIKSPLNIREASN